jgi:quercetin dioxygenase-like cupin family protein
MSSINPVFRATDALLTHQVLGITHRYLARSSETGGKFMIFEVEIPPRAAVAMHSHEVDAESFQLLDGELVFITPHGRKVARTGDFAAFPSGCIHGFANESDRPARALIVQAPGIEAEKFFFAMADSHPTEPQDVMEKVLALAPVHGIHPYRP